MKNFVLYSALEEPHNITKDEFEKYTKNEYPFKQKSDDGIRYYATCPECENPIQIRGLYNKKSTAYGAHTGKDIEGLNPFNYENYIYCPRAIKGHHIPKDKRKLITTQKDIEIYNIIRDNFDLVIAYAKKHLGYYISNRYAKDMLEAYYNSSGWLYPHSTVNNIPFILCYLQVALNPYGLWIRKHSDFEKAVLRSADLQLIPIEDNKYYNKLIPKSNKYTKLTMMIYNHNFKEDNTGKLYESISICISKNISNTPDRYEWKDILEQKIVIPELEFIKFINFNHKYRDKELIEYAHKLMPVL